MNNFSLESATVAFAIIEKQIEKLSSNIENYVIDVFKRHNKTFFNVYFFIQHGCRLKSMTLNHIRVINNENTKFVDKVFLYGDYGKEIKVLPVKDQIAFFELFIKEIEPKMKECGS